MRHKILLILIVIAMACAPRLQARYTQDVDTVSGIVSVIEQSGADIIIVQPEGLASRLYPNSVIKSEQRESGPRITEGIRYRVQVFSDNNRQNAKTNAEYRARLVEQRMPGVRAYVTYDAPYWRVRVGNYQTAAEAQAALKQIKSKFPAFAGDVRMVKVRVN